MWVLKYFGVFFWVLLGGLVSSVLAHIFLAPKIDQVVTTDAALRWVRKYYPKSEDVIVVCPAIDTPTAEVMRCQVRVDNRTLNLDCKNNGCLTSNTP